MDHDATPLRSIAAAFDWGGEFRNIEPLGEGLVNETYRVLIGESAAPRGVLQRINSQVFPQPQWIMDNLRVVSDHVHHRRGPAEPPCRDIRLPEIIGTHDRQDHYEDPQGRYWRALEYLPATHTLERIATPEQAREVGFALGRFHDLIGELPSERLHDPLPGFHVTPQYLARFEAAAPRAQRMASTAELRFCLRFIEQRRQRVGTLEEARRAGRLLPRPIHGDPKLDNILFDPDDQALALIDLDTLKPGLLQYDIADCLRSCCNTGGESPEDLDEVYFDVEIAQIILQSYTRHAGTGLSRQDYLFLLPAIQLIPFELGLRFLTDHLEGDVYFRVDYPKQNLQRALTQFLLVRSIEKQNNRLRRLITRLADTSA